jgi:hypothetical protein
LASSFHHLLKAKDKLMALQAYSSDDAIAKLPGVLANVQEAEKKYGSQ